MTPYLYPPAPTFVDPAKLEPGKQFKRQVSKVIVSILLFFIVYMLLVLLSILLAGACIWAGIALIAAKPSFFTLMIGLGIMGLGIAVFIFLVKFVASVTKNENDLRIEITEATQPGLFDFIRQLTTETNTPFPKKIFIAADVNAAVFYNSSFWSMFLPVRKNLEIGLGFVNSVNISEFKAVMAHEFGHFSQRSMKLGSFTYNVNKVIYNMLYENSGYTRFLDSWGKVSGYFAFFAAGTVYIARAIQAVLKWMYHFINKNYLGLSREMEYHADAVAASVAGGNNLVAALSKLEIAAGCYNTTLENAGEWLKDKMVTNNLYRFHLTVFQQMALDYNLELKDGIPDVSYHFIQSFSRSRINFKNQWASHPTLDERKQQLDNLDITTTPIETSAWTVFENPEALQQEMTNLLYGTSSPEELPETKDPAFFEIWFSNERSENKLPAEYNGFYDNRFISTTGWDIDALALAPVSKNFVDLFSDENSLLQSAINSNNNDLLTVKNIRLQQKEIKSFDFDGEKIDSCNSDIVIKQLETENDALLEQQQLNEKAALAFFHQLFPADDTLNDTYKKFQEFEHFYNRYTFVVNKILEILHPFYNEPCAPDYVLTTIESMQANEEIQLKELLRLVIKEGIFSHENNPLLYDRVMTFNSRSYAYFSNDNFHNEELEELTGIGYAVAGELNKHKWHLYKQLLAQQLERYHSSILAERLKSSSVLN